MPIALLSFGAGADLPRWRQRNNPGPYGLSEILRLPCRANKQRAGFAWSRLLSTWSQDNDFEWQMLTRRFFLIISSWRAPCTRYVTPVTPPPFRRTSRFYTGHWVARRTRFFPPALAGSFVIDPVMIARMGDLRNRRG